MAVKKTVKKAAKAAKPAARKVATRKAVKAPAKKAPAKAAPRKAAVKKAVAKKAAPAAKKAVAKKAAPARVAKPAPAAKKAVPAKSAPAKAAAPTPVKATPAKTAPAKTAPATARKATAKPSTKVGQVQPARAIPARPAGKVAVAVTSRAAAAPAPKTRYKTIPYKTDEATGRPILPEGYKPHPDEEYMSPLQLEYFRQRLLDWRADLVEESKQTIENLKDEVRDVGDDAERATRETENSLELRTRDRYRKLIGKIDSTLKRVDSGEYGFSVDSGEEIGLDRLEARLTAERTIDEQERWEHLQKQIGD